MSSIASVRAMPATLGSKASSGRPYTTSNVSSVAPNGTVRIVASNIQPMEASLAILKDGHL